MDTENSSEGPLTLVAIFDSCGEGKSRNASNKGPQIELERSQAQLEQAQARA